MGIDSNIALSYRAPEIESPVNALAKVMQLQGLQQDQALGRMKMDEYQRSTDDARTLNQLYQTALKSDGTIDRNALYTSAAQRGLGAKIPGLQKTFSEQDEAQGKVAKQKVELVDAKLKQSRQFLDGVTTPEQYLQWHLANHADPILGPELAARGVTPQQSMARIQEKLAQPGGLQQLINESKLGVEKFAELNKPTIHMQDAGDVSNVVSVPGMGGAPTVLSTTPIKQSANNAATVEASRENASATRAVAKATRDAAQIGSNQNTEMKLGDDYRAQSKNFKETADAYKQISAVLDKATTSPAATLAGATKFMKMIDPGSVVRESELGMALAATGVFDRATNYFNTLQSGKVLTASQVADFKAITKQINDAAASQQKLIDNHYSTVAKTYGLRPEMVVQDFGQNAGAPSVPPAAAAPAAIPPGWTVKAH